MTNTAVALTGKGLHCKALLTAAFAQAAMPPMASPTRVAVQNPTRSGKLVGWACRCRGSINWSKGSAYSNRLSLFANSQNLAAETACMLAHELVTTSIRAAIFWP